MGAAALGLGFYCEGTDRMHEFLLTGGEKRNAEGHSCSFIFIPLAIATDRLSI